MNAGNDAKKFISPKGFNVGKWFLETPLPLSTGAKWTYVLLAICSGGNSYAWPDMASLMKNVSASSRTVRRYLDELVRHGFIIITHDYIEGQKRGKKRPIYRFLNHAVLSSENLLEWDKNKAKKAEEVEANTTGFDFDQWEETVEWCENEQARTWAEQAAWEEQRQKSPDSAPANVTNFPGICDKNDTGLYKVESYDLEIPPISPTVENLSITPQGMPESQGTGKGGVEETPKEEIKNEDQAWADAKVLLAERMTAFDLEAYILRPCEFERAENVAVLSFPNEFLRRRAKTLFGEELRESFLQAGFKDFCLEVMSPEEQERHYREIDKREKAERAEAAKIRAEVCGSNPGIAEDFDFGAAPPSELFKKLYEQYPRKERRRKGQSVFEEMARNKAFPPMPVLLAAIRRQSGNPKWQREEGRYVPQLHRWLSERRWED